MQTVSRVCLLAVLLAVTGCGSVCDSAVAAERNANQKGVDCSVQNITVHDANKCNSGLQKCNSDDLNEIQTYSNCLNSLPQCTSGNEIQFRGQRDGCVNQAFFKISFACQSNIL